MRDIVERLRTPRVQDSITETYAEAADEIERLRAALEPFARLQPVTIGFAATFRKPDWADCDWAVGFEGLQPTFRDFVVAREALALSRPYSRSEG